MKLNVENLSYQHQKKGKWVFENVNFTLEAGDFVFILGPNGAGKTTLLNCLSRLYKKYSGTIEMNSIETAQYNQKQLAKLVGFVPQEYNPTFRCTVREFLVMGRVSNLTAFSNPKQTDYDVVDAVIAQKRLEKIANKMLHEISGGERRSALLARALVQDAEMIMLDEPTNQLDFGNQIRLLDSLRDIAESGKAIVLTSHNPEHAINYANKFIVMMDGQLKFYNDVQQLTSELISSLYDIESEVLYSDRFGKQVVVGVDMKK